MVNLTIGAVARQAGVRPSTLRYYEALGLLPAAQRVNRQRRYDSTVLQRLAVIKTAQQAGFTLAEIQQLFDTTTAIALPSQHWRMLARQKIAEAEQLINHTIIRKQFLEQSLECECQSLTTCTLIINCNP